MCRPRVPLTSEQGKNLGLFTGPLTLRARDPPVSFSACCAVPWPASPAPRPRRPYQGHRDDAPLAVPDRLQLSRPPDGPQHRPGADLVRPRERPPLFPHHDVTDQQARRRRRRSRDDLCHGRRPLREPQTGPQPRGNRRERDLIANAANTAALIYDALPDLNWAGFYLYKEGELVLGPFQGKPACVRIAIGKGVCGAAAERRTTVLVEDVHAFPGHIACDSASNSEIVVPLLRGDETRPHLPEADPA